MALPGFFTLEGNLIAFIGDRGSIGDIDFDPDIVGIQGSCILTPLVTTGDALLLSSLTPKPALALPQRIVATFNASGILTYKNQEGVRLLRSGEILGLNGPLLYKVEFGNDLFYGVTKVPPPNSFNFPAPDTDTVVNLVDVARVPGSPGVGMTQGLRGFTPWFVKVTDGPPPLYQAEDPNGPVGDPIELVVVGSDILDGGTPDSPIGTTIDGGAP